MSTKPQHKAQLPKRDTAQARAALLLEHAWELRSEDPVTAEELAREALHVIDHAQPAGTVPRDMNDLRARAWIYIANCRRIRSDHQNAEDMLAVAEGCLQAGSHRPQARAELLLIRAGLYGDMRRIEEALDLMDQVVAIYRWAREQRRLAQALLTKAHILHTADDLQRSLECIEQAEAIVETEEILTDLLFSVKQFRLLHLYQTDQIEAAQDLLPEVLRLAQEAGSRLDRVRTKWVKGLIQGRSGLTAEAERTLCEVRSVFLDECIHYDAALVSLDLAVVLLEAGRLARTRELAEEMIPLFKSLDIRREAFAALILFHRAALQEKATAGMARDIAAFLKRTGNTPALKYEDPS